jgi:hypothetical protein
MKCEYCGFDGGWHGCGLEARHVIERYLSEAEVIDVEELWVLIGKLGFYSTDKGDK